MKASTNPSEILSSWSRRFFGLGRAVVVCVRRFHPGRAGRPEGPEIMFFESVVEFRVFLPWPEDGEEGGDGEYSEAFGKLMHVVLPSLTSLEARTDVYVVGTSFLGLKFRNEKKLEAKFLVSCEPLCPEEKTPVLERYEKIKYGKKGLAAYHDKILHDLALHCNSLNSSSTEEATTDAILRNKILTLRKHRALKHIDNVCFEATIVQAAAVTAASEEEAVAGGVDVGVGGGGGGGGGVGEGEGSKKKWLSVSFEGSRRDVAAFVASTRSSEESEYSSLWTCLELAVAQAKVSANDRVLVLGGYPAFVRFASSGVSSTEEVQEMNEKICSFLSPSTSSSA